MKYFKESLSDDIFFKLPQNFDKDTNVDVLRYCIGTLLYIPAINKKMLENLAQNNIKDLNSVSICLEDSLGINGEAEGIENMQYALKNLKDNVVKGNIDKDDLPLVFIRPKNVEQMLKFKDVLKENLDILTGIIIPKSNSEKIEEFIIRLKEIQCESLYIMPIIETTEFTNIESKDEALHSIYETITKYKDKILSIRMGVTDILGAYSLRRNKNLTIYDNMIFYKFASDLMSMFGCSDELNIPISGGVSEFYDMKNPDILNCYLKEINIDKLNGFLGKTVIHPAQMKVVQAKYIVNYEDYIDAKSILDNVDNKSGVSAGLNKNRMNEVNPHLKWAKRIMTLSMIYGVLKEGVDLDELLRIQLSN